MDLDFHSDSTILGVGDPSHHSLPLHHLSSSQNILQTSFFTYKKSHFSQDLLIFGDTQESGEAAWLLCTTVPWFYSYVSRESTSSILDEKNDAYSFGIFIMEIVSGRVPVDHSEPQAHLVKRLKSMVAKQKILFVVDPKLPEMPSTKELERVILSVDPEVKHRPTMGDVVHMLEPRDLLLNVEPQIKKAASYHNYPEESQPVIKLGNEDSNTHEGENSSNRRQMKI